ncbi:PAAR domain-containing protein [Enhygromyxa salina]|uniref:PAAR motif protein n=1 Tax=Enhygromyxa salina TaxID=215803 RepID=A0A2S9YVJ3_9BACT|nr:PAAR domain-containing protein [Enhygromyxa salina]PRQ09069.1 PAAR motif protein [Enhygromyxa salina]
MPAAARILDPHVCPITGPVPHVGGVIQAPGVPTVLIGHLAAATEGGACVCALGLPNSIVTGSTTVVIGSKAAARVGDLTAHGGKVVAGCSTVLIGG